MSVETARQEILDWVKPAGRDELRAMLDLLVLEAIDGTLDIACDVFQFERGDLAERLNVVKERARQQLAGREVRT